MLPARAAGAKFPKLDLEMVSVPAFLTLPNPRGKLEESKDAECPVYLSPEKPRTPSFGLKHTI